MIKPVKSTNGRFEAWLGGRDSNPDKQSQSLTVPPDSTFFHPAPLLGHRQLAVEATRSAALTLCRPAQLSHNESHKRWSLAEASNER